MLDMNQIRSMLEAELKSWDQVSVGVGIVKDGEVLLADGFGFADAEEGRKADGKTLYQIGSCSKAFTSAAAAVLVDQGKLKWDEPARNYLPWLKFKDSYVSEHVTVRDMDLCALSPLEIAIIIIRAKFNICLWGCDLLNIGKSV